MSKCIHFDIVEVYTHTSAFAYVLRHAVLTNSPDACLPWRLFSMFNAAYDDDQRSSYTETILSCPCSRSITNELFRLYIRAGRVGGWRVCIWVTKSGDPGVIYG
jgi:hypothetical protein